MEKFRSNKLGIEIEISTDKANFLEIKETRSCVKVSYKNKKIVTILPDSKIEFPDINHIVCYKGRIVVFGNAFVEAWGMSKVFATDESYVEACQGAEVRAKVQALDSSRVIATGQAEVYLEGKSIGYRNGSRVKMYRLLRRYNMRKFDCRIEPGTKVKLFGHKCWCTVKSVHPTRQWIELEELVGSFQRGNVEKFSNKPKDRYTE